MMQVSESNQLKRVEILLRCEKQNHDNCSVMTHALMKNFKNILEANTTRTTINGNDYCVAGTALINENDIKKFKKDLKNVKSVNNVGVKNLELYISK